VKKLVVGFRGGQDFVPCEKEGGKGGGRKSVHARFFALLFKEICGFGMCTVHFFCTVHALALFSLLFGMFAKTTLCVVFPLLFSSLHVPRSSRRRRKTLLAFPERGARGSVARRDEPVFPPLFRGRSGPLATEEHSILDQRACEALGFFFCTSLG
jgi:hypothetical protein